MTTRRSALGLLAGSLLAYAAGSFTSAFAGITVDNSPEQKDRVRAEPVPEAQALISKDYKWVEPGVFTVAIALGQLPFGAFASDTTTPIGSEPDLAQLVADTLGLKLNLISVAWADWPLGVTSGKYDAVISNVTVTEARKEKYDFSTYRNDLLGFYVATDSKVQAIKEPKDIAGLRGIVSSGTNQEVILLRWIEQNKAAGLAETEVQYYDDDAVRNLALESGKADFYLGPNATSAFQAAQDGKTRLVGTLSGGYPLTAEIAVTTRKGAGLADAITAAINAQIKNGNYQKHLARWGIEDEGITESRINPPGLPKS